MPTDLQTLGTCLQSAGSNTTTGQKCIETFLGALGLPNTDCFSKSGFTIDAAVAAIKQAIAAGPSGLTQASFQANMAKYAAQLQALVTCLTALPTSSATTDAPVDNGGGATATQAPTSNEAPAATPVSGNPNFTG